MTDMTEARVFELIEAYGSEPEAWPERERDAAQTFLKGAPSTFREAISEAKMLDAMLADMPEPQIPTGLAEQIMATAPVGAHASEGGVLSKLKSVFSIGGSLVPSASALASSVLGLIIGYGALGTATQVASVDSAEEAVYAAFYSEYDDFDIGALNQ